MRDDKSIQNDWKELDSMDKILQALRSREINVLDYLADISSAICNVTKEDMFGSKDKSVISQTRWFFWYSYRYMTGESYERIASLTKDYSGTDKDFTRSAIGMGIRRMSELITNDPLWNKRWIIIKRIIKLRDNEEIAEGVITINIPRKLREHVKIEIKDK